MRHRIPFFHSCCYPPSTCRPPLQAVLWQGAALDKTSFPSLRKQAKNASVFWMPRWELRCLASPCCLPSRHWLQLRPDGTWWTWSNPFQCQEDELWHFLSSYFEHWLVDTTILCTYVYIYIQFYHIILMILYQLKSAVKVWSNLVLWFARNWERTGNGEYD